MIPVGSSDGPVRTSSLAYTECGHNPREIHLCKSYASRYTPALYNIVGYGGNFTHFGYLIRMFCLLSLWVVLRVTIGVECCYCRAYISMSSVGANGLSAQLDSTGRGKFLCSLFSLTPYPAHQQTRPFIIANSFDLASSAILRRQ